MPSLVPFCPNKVKIFQKKSKWGNGRKVFNFLGEVKREGER